MNKKAYTRLKQIYENYYKLTNINSILTWDLAVKMPHNGYNIREKQLSLIAQITTDTIDNQETKQLFQDIDPNILSTAEQRNFFLMKQIFLHKVSVPKTLREEFVKASLKSEFMWRKAKQDNNFHLFNKYFSTVIKLLKEICNIKSNILNLSPYETLLAQYDPGLKEQHIDRLFDKLAKTLPTLISQIIAKQHSFSNFKITKIPENIQKSVYQKLLKKLGLSWQWCRIDESMHPFCTGYPGDVRITTKYSKQDFTSGLMGLIHETGHAIYDNNLPKKDQLQPIGQASSISLHESQSLFMEMQIARSYSFSEFLLPILKKEFGLNNTYQSKDFYHYLNKVKPGYIRIDADEVTYPLHIIMRYKIEKDLIYDNINSNDLPDIWHHYTNKYFNLPNTSDSQGCLQDIHWSDGSLGYFPTYTIGAIFAAQIATKLKQLLPDFNHLIKIGDFKPIITILNKNIHNHGSHFTAQKIIESFSGKKLDVNIYLKYLKQKYLLEL